MVRLDFEDLLRRPLGPYRDCDILHETTCQLKGSTRPVLYSFILDHNGHVAGLDESECPLGEGQHDDRKFRFRGILKIADPDWLSGFGLKTVESELNLRAKEHALREGVRLKELALSDLYSARGPLRRSNDATWGKEEDMKLMVVIQGEKNMPAVYMNAGSRIPNGLLWNSKAGNRNYEVATMDVETYSLSQNFFWQWRLLALMEKIVKQYSYIPEKKRTPRWFVEKYITDFSYPPRDKYHRLIFDENHSDVDETGKTVTPRYPLRPHTSEIFGMFAAHAEWIISNNEAKRKKLFDFKLWDRFAKAVRKQRKEAARQGVRWGYPEGKEAEETSSGEDSEHDLVRMVKENPVIGKSNKTLIRRMRLQRAKPDRGDRQTISSGSESEWDNPNRAEYASDFSEPSEVEEDDSDHWLAEGEAMNQMPWELLLPPTLPDVDGRWECPLKACEYHIDLYNLKTEEEKMIPEEHIIEYILQKQWRNAAYDRTVLEGFRHIVTKHYMRHLEECGVTAEKKEGRTRFVFVGGRRTRHGSDEPIRGPMPARGTLAGESRIDPIVHVEHP